MTKFRNIQTGKVIDLKDRWADKLRTNQHLVELDEEGDEKPRTPSPIADADPALKGLRIADLRAMAEEAGLDTSGSKAVLIARLTEPAAAGDAALPPSPSGPDPEE